MSYTKLNLENGTVLDETHLAHMEDGIAAVSNWDVHTQIKMDEDLSEGFSITEVGGKPLKLREMWARVKVKNNATGWVGCTLRTDTGQNFAGAGSSVGISSNQGDVLYFVYHAWTTETGVAVSTTWRTKDPINLGSGTFQTSPAWLHNWIGYYQSNYFTGIDCANSLSAGTEIEIWGRNA